MSIIDKALAANRNYAKTYNPALGKRPAPKIAVVTCMDPRLSDLPGILGLPHQRHPRARLHFRRGDRSAARSAAHCTAGC